MSGKIRIVLASLMIQTLMLTSCNPFNPAVGNSSPISESDGMNAAIISPVDGMKMYPVPAGEFLMSLAKAEDYTEVNPQSSVYLDAYWIDETEVTNAMFSTFVQETGIQTMAGKIGRLLRFFVISGSLFHR